MGHRQIYFNNRLRIARNQIKCAFGRLNGRWGILERTIDLSLDMAISAIYARFVLHNLMLNIMETEILNEQRIQASRHHNITL